MLAQSAILQGRGHPTFHCSVAGLHRSPDVQQLPHSTQPSPASRALQGQAPADCVTHKTSGLRYVAVEWRHPLGLLGLGLAIQSDAKSRHQKAGTSISREAGGGERGLGASGPVREVFKEPPSPGTTECPTPIIKLTEAIASCFSLPAPCPPSQTYKSLSRPPTCAASPAPPPPPPLVFGFSVEEHTSPLDALPQQVWRGHRPALAPGPWTQRPLLF